MSTLYEIKGSWLQVYEMADDPEMDPEIWFDTMEAIEGELEEKADGYARLYKSFQAMAAAHQAEADLQKKKADAWNNKATRIKERLFQNMNELGKTEIPNALFKIKIAKNGGLAPLVFVEDQEIPEEFQKITVAPDNSKIREALKDKQLTFAYLGERGTRLDIK